VSARENLARVKRSLHEEGGLIEAATPKRSFVFYLLPEFTMLAFACAIEALRLANHVLGKQAYIWRLAGGEEGTVQASCGVALGCETTIAQERSRLKGRLPSSPLPSMVIACAGLHVERYISRPAEAWLRECRQSGVAVAGLCSGSALLARAGLLDDKKCVIHWENFPGFAEQFTRISVKTGLFESDHDIHTCAGGMAAFDMMVHLIRSDFGADIAAKVCEQAIVERIRTGQDRQRLPFAHAQTPQQPHLVRLIERMQENLTDPQPIHHLLRGLGVTRRQMERHFRQVLSISPARYYMKLRLERAQLLLSQTTQPIVEVAIGCGFSSASHFSKCYRQFYGCAPHEARSREKWVNGQGARR